MIYGVEETTDIRHPETVIVKFRTELQARKWAENSGGFAWSGAATESLPRQSQNWHKRFRRIFLMPYGWRPPSKKKLDKERDRFQSRESLIARYVWKYGKELILP